MIKAADTRSAAPFIFPVSLCALLASASGCGGVDRQIRKGRLAQAEAHCRDLAGDERGECFDKVARAYYHRGALDDAERSCRETPEEIQNTCLKRVADARDGKKEWGKAADLYGEIEAYEQEAGCREKAGDEEKALDAWARALVVSALACIDHKLTDEECEAKIEGMAIKVGSADRLCEVVKRASRASFAKGADVTFDTMLNKEVAVDERMNNVQSSKRYRRVGDRLRDYLEQHCPAEPSE
jgi:hypothetical protein